VTPKNLEIFFLEIFFSRFLVCMSKKISRFTFLEKRKSRDFDLYDGPKRSPDSSTRPPVVEVSAVACDTLQRPCTYQLAERKVCHCDCASTQPPFLRGYRNLGGQTKNTNKHTSYWGGSTEGCNLFYFTFLLF